MILLATDYSSTAELTAAIDTYLSNAADIYVTKATYDISRGCDQTDFFINVLHHQAKNGYQDRVQFPGFEDYITPAPIHTVAYLNGFNTTYGTAPSTYTEGSALTITVISGNSEVQLVNVDITLTFGTQTITVTSNAQGVATFTFIPTTAGAVTVTSALEGAPSNAIAAGFHGEQIDTTTYSIDATAAYGFVLDSTGFAVGDHDNGGTVNVSDKTNALALFGTNFRTKFSKHATVELGSLFYNPGVGGTLTYTIRPVGQDYSYGASNTGQAKGVDDLKYSLGIIDSDGTPSISAENGTINGGIVNRTHAIGTLAADGSATGSIAISALFNNPLIAVFALTNVFNKATLTTANLTGLSTSLTTSTFEPNGTVSVAITDGSGDANVAGSLVHLEAYPTASLSGTPLVSQSVLINNGNTATASLNIPATLDQDIFLKMGYTVYTVLNAVTVVNSPNSSVAVAEKMTITSDVVHYTASDQPITLTVAMVSPASRTGFSLSMYAQQVGESTPYAITTNDNTSTLTYEFNPSSGALDASKSIVVTASLVAV